ncbi:pyruvate dehydrogenase (acetyl-transferring), homodimeric type [Pollutimonas nitritireducens]|uniref:Pyruvate dehydrogenase E1 component n=1 Tax=Pollutimonas nitritireducens TaxID=2045209 RepID=A0A2N4UI23_9BURK|nr:alpha-ketoglutarate dehydrogenase [Pollutimonas nitritireducens]PLC54658.1 pyruvate dehydrogenase (acetyl-transferring), homodimeric type [Pollutimonas nitritireducens]
MNASLSLSHYTHDRSDTTIDIDPEETAEWREAFQSLLAAHGPARAGFMLGELEKLASSAGIAWNAPLGTPYVNTIAVDRQAPFPGDLALEEKLGAIMRWNALVMVVRANAAYGELGGHIASYASAADLFEVGFNHFFHAREHTAGGHGGDLVFFQPHSAPGVYARAFLEGRLTQADLQHYRQELEGPCHGARGLSSYPHPYLMPDFWQFPTGSMGIGPISSIYQARFMRYLTHRGLISCEGRKVWGVFGDGEMDEPESMSALTLAAREGLDNLVWVVNCNLQRLDGPVRGNGRVIDELEKLFLGAGWNVIKTLWGSDWDGLFARDHNGALTSALSRTVDGQMQTFAAKDGRYNRDHFFGQNDELKRLVEGLSDEQIDRLRRGGHDVVKIYAAYAAAAEHKGQPTVIFAHTKKGYGMGSAGQGRMTTHSHKKLDAGDLIAFRDRFKLPLTDEQVVGLEFYKPAAGSPEMQYLHAKRNSLGGYLPARNTEVAIVPVPDLERYGRFALAESGREMSTTMAFVRLLGALLKDDGLGARIVPIVADEARTFGMANLFKQVGIYSSVGQRYEPEDIGSILHYHEAIDGQILEEGISEAGAISSWVAAATSYSVHGTAMLPFYIYYSMFGFQRVGDLIWAAADQRPRGFLIGATSGRTTLAGEGLQHQDGTSHLVASTIPNCKAYDPAFACELAVIVDQGMRDMLVDQKDVFYYITTMNENYVQPALVEDSGDGILRGAYRFARFEAAGAATAANGKAAGLPTRVTLLGSGAILIEVIKAAETLAQMGITSDVLSITSWSELARDGQRYQSARLENTPLEGQAFIAEQLADSGGPIIAATDYVRLVPESIRAYLPAGREYITLGTDGFGRSDTRAKLRRFFDVDAQAVVNAALISLGQKAQ